MRTRFVRPLSSEEEQALTSLYREGRCFLERRRAHFILLSAGGRLLNEAAELIGMSRKTGGRTLRVFEAQGVDALREKPRGGPRPALDAEQRAQVAEVLKGSPRAQGYATNNWTGPVLRSYLTKTFKVTLSVSQVQRLMHRVGFRLVRARRKLAKGDA